MRQNDYRTAMDALPFREDFQRETIEKLLTAAKQQTGKETANMNINRFKRILPIAAALVVILAATAAAVMTFLSASDVAGEFNDPTLAQAFAQEDALALNQTVESEGYELTLAGLVSGAGLSDYCQEAEAEYTYAVVSVRRTDGTPLEYGDVDLTVTPLISGYNPWAVNAWTLNGGYGAFAQDGVLYYLFQYDSLEIFAGHTVYLAIYDGFVPSRADFVVAEDGSISFSDAFEGPHALFTLPMDESTGDEEAIARYFAENGIDLEWALPTAGDNAGNGDDGAGPVDDSPVLQAEDQPDPLIAG